MFGIEHRILKISKLINIRRLRRPASGIHTLTFLTANSLLELMLEDAASPKLVASLAHVFLSPGVLFVEPSCDHVYFPEDALLALSQSKPAIDTVDVAVVGRHACIGPAELWGVQMQAAVIVPGYAYRLDWSSIKQDPGLYGSWLWRTTAVTHGLIEQMAQTAFCANHHNATQRLASWLMICLAQYGGASLIMPLDVVPASLRQQAQAFEMALDVLEKQQAIQVEDAKVRVIDAKRLAGVACRCHTMVTRSVAERQPRPL